MLSTEELDAVHVLLPPDLHFQAASAILQAGVSVFVEKPMCVRVTECQRLIQLAEERRLKLGVGHNFLFAAGYERLRGDLQSGILGTIDHLTITWHRELQQITRGPFDSWMLREPQNVMLEIGTHCVSQILDLVGPPDSLDATASNSIDLPSGHKFYRRWQINATKGQNSIDLRLSFVPGFGEYTIHARGSLGSATVDFERDTYVLRRHRARSEDFDRYAMLMDEAKSVRRQARKTLWRYGLSKLFPTAFSGPYMLSIAGAMGAFYASLSGRPLDDLISGRFGAKVTGLCEEITSSAEIVAQPRPSSRLSVKSAPSRVRILLLGATGFIGNRLARGLLESGYSVRALVRSPGKVAHDLLNYLDCRVGDLTNPEDLHDAMQGIDCVYHLARADAKSWADYQRHEIDVTREIANAALATGVKRLIYTGTIDSYYAGIHAGKITEETPLDAQISRRNLYARAKAASEGVLLQMHQEQELPVVILRPGIVIGSGGSPTHWGIGMWWYGSVCQIWGAGRNPLPLVLVEDVAAALIAAMHAKGIDGESFNLVGDVRLSGLEYLAEVNRCGGIRIQSFETPIVKFFGLDVFKWLVKVAIKHPDRRFPSYKDWESRTQRATFDCTRAKRLLHWSPVSDRDEFVYKGIREPVREWLSLGEHEANGREVGAEAGRTTDLQPG
jgi:nucleoside-diphosphate-sugar epimerase/predicted dehydrogenase